jgi:hypothetical protein
MRDVWATPRSVPSRLVPVAAGAAVVGLALPVFAVADWSLRGWALGAILWVGAQALGVLLSRLRLGADNLAASGVRGVGMMFRPVAVMVVVIAVAASNPEVGVAAGLLYALAYTLELGLSLLTYFGNPAQR